MNWRAILPIAAAVAALSIASCGGDSDATSAEASTAEATSETTSAAPSQATSTATSQAPSQATPAATPAGASANASMEPVVRNIQVTAFEIKGSTSASELAPPEVDPTTLSSGYGFKDVGVFEADSDKWQVASYLWSPGALTAFAGDTLDLNIFVLNGNTHETWVEGPNGETVVSPTELNRGREYQISFEATQPGVYRLICNTHAPTMTADILVLPN